MDDLLELDQDPGDKQLEVMTLSRTDRMQRKKNTSTLVAEQTKVDVCPVFLDISRSYNFAVIHPAQCDQSSTLSEAAARASLSM